MPSRIEISVGEDGLRECTMCHERRPEADFYSMREGAFTRRSRHECKECYRTYQREYARAHPEKNRKRYEDKKKRPERFMCANAKTRARRFGLPFDLTPEDIFIPEFCPILGIRLAPVGAKMSNESPSLDRLDPKLGYVRGNVAVISMRANRLKDDATAEEHERIAAWMRAQGDPVNVH